MILYPISGKYQTNQKFDISVIIPMHKSKKVIAEQIRRWPLTDQGLKVEIIYINDLCPENSSQSVMQEWNKRTDKDEFNVKLILNQVNKGFGGACNTGAFHAQGKHLIFLNADTVPEPNWIAPIHKLLEQEDVGIVGNLQLKEGGELHGTIDGAGSEWDWSEVNFSHIGRHILDGQVLEKPLYLDELPNHLNCEGEREMVTGCCLGINKKFFEYIGGFNTNYKIGYWEDSELCLTVRERGKKVMFTPKSIVWHKLSHAKIGKHDYHDSNRQYFINKWDSTGRIDRLVEEERPMARQEIKKILVKRNGANGDVIMAAGVVPALKKQFPKAKIHFNTGCPSVLKNHPDIERVIGDVEAFNRLHQYDYIVELNMAYERRPKVHILTSYAEEANVKIEDMSFFIHCEKHNHKLPEKYIVFHAGQTNWLGRNWKTERFEKIANQLLEQGEKIVCIGQGGDKLIPCTIDLRSRVNLFQCAEVIKNAEMFIGIDSMPMHIAQVVETPGVAFFGSVDPKTRLLHGEGISSKGIKAMTANVNCLGCLHRQLPPVVSLNHCETGHLDCEEKLSINDAWLSISNKLRRIRNAT